MDIEQWVVQGNLGKTSDVDKIEQACHKIGCDFHRVSIIPFSDELPDHIPYEKSTVFYGSSNFTTNVYKSKKWTPGVFFCEDSFRYSIAIQHYGKQMLNYDAIMLPMKELAQQSIPEEQIMFFRPDRDLKEFAGDTRPFGDFKNWVERLSEGDFAIDLSTIVLAAETKVLEHEWRVFIVNGKLVSGSHYRSYQDLVVTENVPEEVREFVEHAADLWAPAPVFVMDIAQSNGSLFILEINGFNSSGFYKSDIEKIITAVSHYKSYH